jgi:ABC-2 type transport system ATP-binding protein
MFIDDGRVTLDRSMDQVAEEYVEVLATPDKAAAAQALKPLYEREMFGKKLYLFEGVSRDELSKLGELHTPSVADIFVAKVRGGMQ